MMGINRMFLSSKKIFPLSASWSNFSENNYLIFFFSLSGKKENFEKRPDYIPSVKLGKREPEEETSSNQGKIDRMNRRLNVHQVSVYYIFQAHEHAMLLYHQCHYIEVHAFYIYIVLILLLL